MNESVTIPKDYKQRAIVEIFKYQRSASVPDGNKRNHDHSMEQPSPRLFINDDKNDKNDKNDDNDDNDNDSYYSMVEDSDDFSMVPDESSSESPSASHSPSLPVKSSSSNPLPSEPAKSPYVPTSPPKSMKNVKYFGFSDDELQTAEIPKTNPLKQEQEQEREREWEQEGDDHLLTLSRNYSTVEFQSNSGYYYTFPTAMALVWFAQKHHCFSLPQWHFWERIASSEIQPNATTNTDVRANTNVTDVYGDILVNDDRQSGHYVNYQDSFRFVNVRQNGNLQPKLQRNLVFDDNRGIIHKTLKPKRSSFITRNRMYTRKESSCRRCEIHSFYYQDDNSFHREVQLTNLRNYQIHPLTNHKLSISRIEELAIGSGSLKYIKSFTISGIRYLKVLRFQPFCDVDCDFLFNLSRMESSLKVSISNCQDLREIVFDSFSCVSGSSLILSGILSISH